MKASIIYLLLVCGLLIASVTEASLEYEVRMKAHMCMHVTCMLHVYMQAPEQKDGSRVRRQISSTHPVQEILAQSICEGIAGNRSMTGWIYAVQRYCSSSNRETCQDICSSTVLCGQDSQTAHSTWSALDSIHVYTSRPSSDPGTRNAPHIGLKVFWFNSIRRGDCGPNYCCCHAA